MPHKSLNDIRQDVFDKIPHQLTETDRILEEKPLKPANYALFRQYVSESFEMVLQHEEDMHHFCKRNRIKYSNFDRSKFNFILDNLSKAEAIVLKKRITSDDFKTLQDYVLSLDGIWEERYWEHFEEGLKFGLLIQERLNIDKEHFANIPEAQLIRENLCPRRIHLRKTPIIKPTVEETETYTRSAKHPRGKNNIGIGIYDNNHKELKNGGHAHAGNYLNTFATLERNFRRNARTPVTTVGNSSLYDAQLKHRLFICEYIKTQMNNENTHYMQVGFHHKYPCIMVHIKRTTIPRSAILTDAAFHSWVNLLASNFVGIVNYEAFSDDIAIEMERRSGFGAITPSIAPTHDSFRINVGLIPKAYAHCIVDALKQLNSILQQLPHLRLPIPNNCFFNTPIYRQQYLKGKVIPQAQNLQQLLWAQVEKAGKTTLQNITRKSFMRETMSIFMFNRLYDGDNGITAFSKLLTWSVQQMKVTYINKTYKLGCSIENAMKHAEKFDKFAEVTFPNEPEFWGIIQAYVDRARAINHDRFLDVIGEIECAIQAKNINLLYFHLELLAELLFIHSIEKSIQHNVAEDGYGSDSDTEEDIGGNRIYHKKLIVNNGMRAIWASLRSTAKLQSDNKAHVYTDNMYYEVKLGINAIKKLHPDFAISKKRVPHTAKILMQDLNACITNGVPMTDVFDKQKHKVLILDITSALNVDVKQQIDRFCESNAEILMLVDSGYKLQQTLMDKNHYGTIRIITKNRQMTNTLYRMIKQDEPGVYSKVSHQLRRDAKSHNSVPTISYLLGRPGNQ